VTVVLFCGGEGLRLRERTRRVRKPLVPIGGDAILRHLMRYYAHYGHRHFVLCLGYQGDAVVRHFLRGRGRTAVEPLPDQSVRVRLQTETLGQWVVDLVPTGHGTPIGERLRAVRSYIEGPVFLANYADGLSDLNLPDFLARFARSGATAGLISVPAHSTLHLVTLERDGLVDAVRSAADCGLRINGGFFAMRREVFDHLAPGEDLATDLFPRLVAARRLFGYRHDGFWACMDTPKDWRALAEMDARGIAPWKVWLGRPAAAPVAAPAPQAAAASRAMS